MVLVSEKVFRLKSVSISLNAEKESTPPGPDAPLRLLWKRRQPFFCSCRLERAVPKVFRISFVFIPFVSRELFCSCCCLCSCHSSVEALRQFNFGLASPVGSFHGSLTCFVTTLQRYWAAPSATGFCSFCTLLYTGLASISLGRFRWVDGK